MTSRLQIPCLFASAVFHAVLLALLFAGAGFVSSRSHTEPTVIVNFVPDQLIAAPLVGGGSPTASVLPPKPPAQKPPARTKTGEPTPPPQPKQSKPTPPATKQPALERDLASRPEPTKTAPRKIEVNKTPVIRQAQPSQTSRGSSARVAEEAARQKREAERMANQFRALISSAADKLQGNLSDRTVVPESFGPGGGGPTYAGYDLYVVSLYQRAFQPPVEITDESATTRVKIVIARDGTVVESRIISPSGVAALDRAVQAALDRVNTIGQPLPDEIKSDRHTIIIRFNLKTKKLFG